MTKKPFIPTITGLLLLLGAVLLITSSPSSAQTGPQTWFLRDVTYDTGATANGSFTFDADTGTYSNIDITISNSPVNGDTNTFAARNPGSLGNDVFFSAVPQVQANMTGIKAMTFVFATGLTNAGGTVQILPVPPTPRFKGPATSPASRSTGPTTGS